MKTNHYHIATFAGGCFWCSQQVFAKLDGVVKAIAGYAGGDKSDPTYSEVASGETNHREAIQVVYDPNFISYNALLEIFLNNIDPTDDQGQFLDRGYQYTTAIFYHDEQQKKLAKNKIKIHEDLLDKKIVTKVLKFKNFYKAEEAHQEFYKKNPLKYNLYKRYSRRDKVLEDNLKEKLTDMQYKVTQKAKTEPPFDNDYWDNNKEGVYVDVITGEPLFSSNDKYESGTGWPSFTKPMHKRAIYYKNDNRLFNNRTEVLSKSSGAHLGHVFEDGPKPLGLRYCINSAALKFIPQNK